MMDDFGEGDVKKQRHRDHPEAAAPAEPDSKPKSGWGAEPVAASTATTVELANIPDYQFAEADQAVALPAEENEALAGEMAAPPKFPAPVVHSVRDLERELKHIIPPPQDPVELSILTAVLSSPASVMEADKKWDFAGLFSKLSSEIQAEQELQEHEKEVLEERPQTSASAAKVPRSPDQLL
eukprot:TRINITY_DN4096_c0_g1_i3.p1 TRINITY_DN4096_c0_g1~~TRINITY_DN4096_c0_g1_i3.p1  ORF type:complete len:182 (-),score=59.58 TRINITY_DN4096_c0_g1_i3:25-570(-)